MLFSATEIAAHPAEKNGGEEFWSMCDEIEGFIPPEMEKHKIVCEPVQDQGYGRLTKLTLPGGGKLGVYQPRHERPPSMPL